MTTLLLVYQQPLPKYEGEDFRNILVKFILKTEKDALVKSSVPFSIYLSTDKPSPLKNWHNSLMEEFGSVFKFTLCVVEKYVNIGDKIEENVDYINSEEFDKIINEIKDV